MRYISIAIATLCVVLASTASAQTSCEEIGGAGTPGFIPQFTRTCKIGNSNIFQSSSGNIGIGSTFPTVPLYVFSSNPVGPPGYNPITMWAESAADNTQGAVYAVSSSPVGGFALNGEANGGTGVIGQGGQNGVVGQTSSTDKFAVGVFGVSLATSGAGSVGVFGQAWSPGATAGLFANVAAGDIIVGGVGQPEVHVFRVDGQGTVHANGGFQPNGADFAESMAVKGDRSKYAAGDLLAIDPTASRRLALAREAYSTLVAGIYSAKPGLLGTNRKVDESTPQNEVPLAVVGIVPCKVTAENGPIRVGDLLVTSSTPGHAMKGTDLSRMLGAVVGKALEPLLEGNGVINVLVTLQ